MSTLAALFDSADGGDPLAADALFKTLYAEAVLYGSLFADGLETGSGEILWTDVSP